MNNNKFWKLRDELLKRTVGDDDNYLEVKKSKSYNALMGFVKENFLDLCKEGILDADIISRYVRKFMEHRIYLDYRSGKLVDAYMYVTHVITSVHGNSFVYAIGKADVSAWGNSNVIARDHAHVVATDNTIIEAHDSVHVIGWDNAKIDAFDNAFVNPHGKCEVKACDRSEVVAYISPTVYLYDDARCWADDETVVFAYDNSIVESVERNAQVYIHDNASINKDLRK